MEYTTYESHRGINCFNSCKTFLPSPPPSPSYSNPSPQLIPPSPLTSNAHPLHAIITSSSSWTYLSEGASNLLYRYTGPPSPVFVSHRFPTHLNCPTNPQITVKLPSSPPQIPTRLTRYPHQLHCPTNTLPPRSRS